MSQKSTSLSASTMAGLQKVIDAERRCDDYRRAFLLMLDEPFQSLDETLRRMLAVLSTTLNVERVGFWAFADGGNVIECRHQFLRSTSAARVPPSLSRSEYPDYFRALGRQLVISAANARTDTRTRELTTRYLEPLGITSMLDVPVRAFGRYIGVLCHEQVGPARKWTAEDEQFATGVATQIALAHERSHAQQAQQQLLDRTLHDEESGLSNCVHLDSGISDYMSDGRRRIALVVTSVDQYSYVAAALGTRRMQELVRQFAERLQALAPPNALVGRIAPNEFAVLLPDVEEADLHGTVSEWDRSMKAPLLSGEQRLFLTLSTGYSCWSPGQESTTGQLRTEARLAAIEARDEGGDRIKPFSAAMRERMLGRIRMEQDLRRALEAQEFTLHFQPIVELGSQRCVAVEALLRWQHPERGVLLPAEFLPVALESGIMLELGRRVLKSACRGIVTLRERSGLADLRVTVNMSAPEVLLLGTAGLIQRELEDAGLEASALTIEVTESALIQDLDRACAALKEIRACGVRISVDDFGTAYSSLSWLRSLPIDTVKIDRSFIAGVAREKKDAAIVSSIISLADALDQKVVAEGVESTEQLRALSTLGLQYAQGYLLARPQPLEELSGAMLRSLGSRVGLDRIEEGVHENGRAQQA